MDIQEIIQELSDKKNLFNEITHIDQLSGGTTSKLYLLRDREDKKYVIKFNEPQVLEAEAFYLTFYKNVDLLPDLIYAEPSNRYIVYSFVAGSVNYHRGNKKELLNGLVKNLINHYKPVSKTLGWGWADEPTDSWQSFLRSRVNDSSATLESYLEKEDHHLVLKLVNSPNRYSELKESYLLHGDCGVHNFIFNEEKLDGVIDPTPVYGEPLYDLIYSFCSSPDNLTKETICFASSLLQTNENKNESLLHQEVLIGLYCRMATCVCHHPEDLKEYLKAWDYWKNIVKTAR